MSTDFSSKYMLGKKIGSGAEGVVYAVLDRKHNQRRVAKIFSARKRKSARDTIKAHTDLEYARNGVQLLDHFVEGKTFTLVFPLYNKRDIYEMTNRMSVKLSTKRIKRIIRDVLRFLDDINDYGYCHNDIKPENVFCNVDKKTGEESYHVGDYSFVRKIGTKVKHSMGTVIYMPPEMNNIDDVYFYPSMDSWSVGILAWELITLDNPLAEKDLEYDELIKLTDNLDKKYGKDFQDFVCSALTYDMHYRPTPSDLLNHKWLETRNE